MILAAGLLVHPPAASKTVDPRGAREASAATLLNAFEADLSAHQSATATLERWCQMRGLAAEPHVFARVRRDIDKPATPQVRQALAVSDGQPVRYRRVQLICADHVLSEADNWYVPARLTPEMNRALETSDVAFGHAVQALNFKRRVLSSERLWRPSRPSAATPASPLPAVVLRQRAVLVLPDGTPFSEVVEAYTSALFTERPSRP